VYYILVTSTGNLGLLKFCFVWGLTNYQIYFYTKDSYLFFTKNILFWEDILFFLNSKNLTVVLLLTIFIYFHNLWLLILPVLYNYYLHYFNVLFVWVLKTKVTYLNLLLVNNINFIHPLGIYAVTAYLITTLLLGTYFTYNPTGTLYKKNLNLTYCNLPTQKVIITVLMLGAWWALQEGTWGGWWFWDSSEFLIVLLLLVSLIRLHYKSTAITHNNFYTAQTLLFTAVYLFFTFNQLGITPNFHIFLTDNYNSIFLKRGSVCMYYIILGSLLFTIRPRLYLFNSAVRLYYTYLINPSAIISAFSVIVLFTITGQYFYNCLILFLLAPHYALYFYTTSTLLWSAHIPLVYFTTLVTCNYVLKFSFFKYQTFLAALASINIFSNLLVTAYCSLHTQYNLLTLLKKNYFTANTVIFTFGSSQVFNFLVFPAAGYSYFTNTINSFTFALLLL